MTFFLGAHRYLFDGGRGGSIFERVFVVGQRWRRVLFTRRRLYLSPSGNGKISSCHGNAEEESMSLSDRPPPPPPPTLRGQGRANDRNVGVVRMTGRPGEALFPASIFRVSSQYLLGIFRMSSFFRVFSSI